MPQPPCVCTWSARGLPPAAARTQAPRPCGCTPTVSFRTAGPLSSVDAAKLRAPSTAAAGLSSSPARGQIVISLSPLRPHSLSCGRCVHGPLQGRRVQGGEGTCTDRASPPRAFLLSPSPLAIVHPARAPYEPPLMPKKDVEPRRGVVLPAAEAKVEPRGGGAPPN